jgi:hypothetical protein
LFSAHGLRLPDGYTVLPMRHVTTTKTAAIAISGRVTENLHIVNRVCERLQGDEARLTQLFA